MVQTGGHIDAHTEFMSELLDDVQTQSRAGCFAGAIVLRAVELFENALLIGLTDAYTGVFHGKEYAFVGLTDMERYAALLGILNRICDEVL